MQINRQACLKQWAFIDEFSAKHQAASQIFAAEMMVIPTMWAGSICNAKHQAPGGPKTCCTKTPREILYSQKCGQDLSVNRRSQSPSRTTSPTKKIQGVGFIQILGINWERSE
jgi:hypothetical protein